MYFWPPETLSLGLEVDGQVKCVGNVFGTHSQQSVSKFRRQVETPRSFHLVTGFVEYFLNNYLNSQTFVVLILDILLHPGIIIGNLNRG